MIVRLLFAVVCVGTILTPLVESASLADDVVPTMKIVELAFQHPTNAQKPNSGGLGKTLLVTFEKGDARKLFDWAKAKNKILGLYLDGVFLKGISADLSPGQPESVLQFTLIRTADNRNQWGNLLGKSWFQPRQAQVTVGTEDKTLLATSNDGIELVPLPGHRLWLLGVAALIVLVSGVFAFNPNFRTGAGTLLRDGDKDSPYSLARTQMWLWFLQIIVAFLLISAVTGAVDTITPSMLVLMGISSATGAASVAVAPATPRQKSTFLMDLLCDEPNSRIVSLHRLQLLTWTIVLICIFWGSVWESLVMPEFDNTLLALMGVSSGTYLGFKINSK